MFSYAYHLRDVNAKRLFGGVVCAKSMEEAAKKVVIRLSLVVDPEWSWRYLLDGKPVDLYILVSPDNLGAWREVEE